VINVRDPSLICFCSPSSLISIASQCRIYTLLHFILLDGLSSSHNASLLDFCYPSFETQVFLLRVFHYLIEFHDSSLIRIIPNTMTYPCFFYSIMPASFLSHYRNVTPRIDLHDCEGYSWSVLRQVSIMICHLLAG
jgi:hypothetical protein